jgi:hypothetical protein
VYYGGKVYLCLDLNKTVQILALTWKENDGNGFFVYDSICPASFILLPNTAVHQIMVCSYGMEKSDDAVRRWCDMTQWRFIMRPWPKHDILNMAKMCYPSFNIKEVMERFKLYGGKPRHIFSTSGSELNEERALFRRLKDLDLEQAFNTVGGSGQSSAAYVGTLFTVVPEAYPTKSGNKYLWQKQGFTNRSFVKPLFVSWNKMSQKYERFTACNPGLVVLHGLLLKRFFRRIVTSISTSSPYRSLENEIEMGPLELPCMQCNLFRSIEEIRMGCYNQPIVLKTSRELIHLFRHSVLLSKGKT